MTEDPTRWSQPFAALLGAYEAQLGFGLPSIGGKDSMSGTFNEHRRAADPGFLCGGCGRSEGHHYSGV